MRARRAASFGARAGEYARHRPDYPAEAIEWILDAGDGVTSHTGPVPHVLDLGAGTGLLTAGLLDAGRRLPGGLVVTAVEPDDAMRAELATRFPEVVALRGTAEGIPLGDGDVDAVLVGQAFHWFDADRALAEIARVLRPGGAVGMLWNYEDTGVDWVAELVRLKDTSVSRTWPGQSEPPAHPEFSGFEQAVFDHAHRRTAESLTATIATQSHVLVAPQQERDAVLGRLLAYLLARPETADGEFDVPLRTTTFRARRR